MLVVKIKKKKKLCTLIILLRNYFWCLGPEEIMERYPGLTKGFHEGDIT